MTKPAPEKTVKPTVVKELGGYISTGAACTLLDCKASTLSYLVRSGNIQAITLEGSEYQLIDKKSIDNYIVKREEREQEREKNRTTRQAETAEKERQKALREKLSTLTPEQLEKLLASVAK